MNAAATALTFSYAGSIPLASDIAKAVALATTRKRKCDATIERSEDSKVFKESPVPSSVYDIVHDNISNKMENKISLNGAELIREKLFIAHLCVISIEKT